ncbi:MAG: hypothetical protein LUQ65_03020 [Candidatus Helarchaeota archaeon]|nr:hypothetical protein [Candidatus Helarchaeota archaeon]
MENNLKLQKCGKTLRAGITVAFWAWIIVYPISVNVFNFHIYAPLADMAFFVGLPAVAMPFFLYLRSTFKTNIPPALSSGFFISKNIVITTIFLISIFATTDYFLIKKLRHPIFSIEAGMYTDGGTMIYFGTGYNIYAYHGVSPTRVHRGPKLDILYMPFLSIDGSFYEYPRK